MPFARYSCAAGLLLLFLFPIIAGTATPGPRHDPAKIQRMLRARLTADGNPSGDAHLKSLQQKAAMQRRDTAAQKRVHRVTVHAVIGGTTDAWKPIGPMPMTSDPAQVPVVQFSGKVNDIAVDPTDSNTVYIATDSGGVWKSLDGGGHWAPLTDNGALVGIGAIAIDPSNHLVVYAGCGGNHGFDLQGGIIKTIDGGKTWQIVSAPFVANGWRPTFRQIVVDPHNGNNILAATDYGLFRSADAGMTWSHSMPLEDVDSVAFDPNTPSLAYYTINYYHDPVAGLYRSTDSGATWTHIGTTGVNPLPSTEWLHPRVFVDPVTPTTLYVQMAWTSYSDVPIPHPGAIYKSIDGGVNWFQIAIPGLCCQSYTNLFAINPRNPNILYDGIDQLFRSTDGGVTWSGMSNSTAGSAVNLHADQHAIAFSADGSIMYEGNDGGVFRTVSPAAPTFNWISLNATLDTALMLPGMSIDPNNPSNTIIGTQDTGTIQFDGALSWALVPGCGDGGYNYIDPSNSMNIVSACFSPEWVVRSTTGGTTGSFSPGSGLNPVEPVSYPPPLVGDPSHPQTLYYGAQHIYQSTDGAATWAAISPDLTQTQFTNSVIAAIAVAPNDPNFVVAATGDSRMWSTMNASAESAAVWKNITNGLDIPAPGKGGGYWDALAIDPQSEKTIYVGMYGFNTAHVEMSADQGATWVNISNDLPDTPVNSLVLDPDLPNTIYVGTEIGVFWSGDNGASWHVLGVGLPTVIVSSIAMDRASRTLRAATYGRGAWDLSIPIPPPLDLSAAALSFSDTVVGIAAASQSITLTNNRRGAIVIGSIAASGDYTQTNTCGSSIPAGGSCRISVIFQPTGVDSRPGSVTILTPGISEAVSLGGKGTITATLSASASTVTAGQPATLSWASQSVASCTASGGGTGDGWAGAKSPSGSSALTESTAGSYTYLLTCVAGQQSVSSQVKVIDAAPPSNQGGGGSFDYFDLLGLVFTTICACGFRTKRELAFFQEHL